MGCACHFNASIGFFITSTIVSPTVLLLTQVTAFPCIYVATAGTEKIDIFGDSLCTIPFGTFSNGVIDWQAHFANNALALNGGHFNNVSSFFSQIPLVLGNCMGPHAMLNTQSCDGNTGAAQGGFYSVQGS